VYVLISGNDSGFKGLYRSTDAGLTFTARALLRISSAGRAMEATRADRVGMTLLWLPIPQMLIMCI